MKSKLGSFYIQTMNNVVLLCLLWAHLGAVSYFRIVANLPQQRVHLAYNSLGSALLLLQLLFLATLHLYNKHCFTIATLIGSNPIYNDFFRPLNWADQAHVVLLLLLYAGWSNNLHPLPTTYRQIRVV